MCGVQQQPSRVPRHAPPCYEPSYFEFVSYFAFRASDFLCPPLRLSVLCVSSPPCPIRDCPPAASASASPRRRNWSRLLTIFRARQRGISVNSQELPPFPCSSEAFCELVVAQTTRMWPFPWTLEDLVGSMTRERRYPSGTTTPSCIRIPIDTLKTHRHAKNRAPIAIPRKCARWATNRYDFRSPRSLRRKALRDILARELARRASNVNNTNALQPITRKHVPMAA